MKLFVEFAFSTFLIFEELHQVGRLPILPIHIAHFDNCMGHG